MKFFLMVFVFFSLNAFSSQEAKVKEMNSFCCIDLKNVNANVKVVFDSKLVSEIESYSLNVITLKKTYGNEITDHITGKNIYSQNNSDKILNAKVLKKNGDLLYYFDQTLAGESYQRLICGVFMTQRIKIYPWIYIGQSLAEFQKKFNFSEKNIDVIVVSSVEQVSQIEFYFKEGLLYKVIYNYTFDLPADWD